MILSNGASAPTPTAAAAAERRTLDRWWDREADAMWARYGWERPRTTGDRLGRIERAIHDLPAQIGEASR